MINPEIIASSIGVPEQAFVPNTSDVIIGSVSHKHRLFYRAEQEKHSIVALNCKHIQSVLYLQGQYLMAAIQTRGFSPRPNVEGRGHHPDMFATHLFLRQYLYLINQHQRARYFRAEWLESDYFSTNFQRFMSVYSVAASRSSLELLHNAVGPISLSESRAAHEAATSTWTGRLLARIGFTKITQITYEPEHHVQVIFEKTHDVPIRVEAI